MILVDTHIVIWLALNPEQLSKRAVTAITAARQADGGVAISGITLYELACAASKHRFRLTMPIEVFMQDAAERYVIKPITAEIAVAAVRLPTTYPKDPMDRIIGATALLEGLTLVTADRAIRESKVIDVIW